MLINLSRCDLDRSVESLAVTEDFIFLNFAISPEIKALYEHLMLAIRRERRRVQKSLCAASFAVHAVVKQ